MPKLVQIALPLASDKLFSYYLPEEILINDTLLIGINSENIIGSRALVPFGNRYLTGVVVNFELENSISNELKEINYKYIKEILDEKPVFSKNMLDFTKWIAEYYFCSWGYVLKAAMPQGSTKKSTIKVKLKKKISDEEIIEIFGKSKNKIAVILELMQHDKAVSTSFLAKKLRIKSLNVILKSLIKNDWLLIENSINEETQIKMQKAVTISPELIDN